VQSICAFEVSKSYRVRVLVSVCTRAKGALDAIVRRIACGGVGPIYRWLHSTAFWWTDPLNREKLGLRLRSKIFLGSALVILVLAGVSALSLAAVDRLVSANREITTRAVPTLSLTASNREAMPRLQRLETRAIVLGDRRYAIAWTKLAAEVGEDFARLAAYALSEDEAVRLREASAAFAEYRRIVAEEHSLLRRGDRAQALRLADTAARGRSEEVQDSLDRLMAATRARILAARAEAAHVEARTWSAVLIALGVAVGLALLGAAIIARRITRSLDRLSSATAEVAANEFHEPIAIEGRDEIAALARSFNSMASRLRQVEEEKQAFFAALSHELRSPLTSIHGAVDLLHRGTPGPLTQRQDRLTDIIGQSSERLLRLVNQILEVSRFRAGLVELDRKPLHLGELVDRVAEELHPRPSKRASLWSASATGPTSPTWATRNGSTSWCSISAPTPSALPHAAVALSCVSSTQVRSSSCTSRTRASAFLLMRWRPSSNPTDRLTKTAGAAASAWPSCKASRAHTEVA